MPLYRAPAAAGSDPTAIPLPEIGSASQAWGLPNTPLLVANSTGAFGEAFHLFTVTRAITLTAAMIWVTTGPAGDQPKSRPTFCSDGAHHE